MTDFIVTAKRTVERWLHKQGLVLLHRPRSRAWLFQTRPALAFTARLGSNRSGFERVGWKNGAWLHVAWLQRDLGDSDPVAPPTELPR